MTLHEQVQAKLESIGITASVQEIRSAHAAMCQRLHRCRFDDIVSEIFIAKCTL